MRKPKLKIRIMPNLVNKKGSSCVFLCMILICMITTTFVFINAASKTARVSRQDGIIRLGCNSIMAEFFIPLYQEYGVLAFKGNAEDICKKAQYYLNYNIKPSPPLISIDNKKYMLIDTSAFGEQINNAAKYELLSEIQDIHSKNGLESEDTPDFPKDVKSEGAPDFKSQIRNESVINGLPSIGYKQGSIISKIKAISESSLEEIVRMQGEKFLIDKYIFNNFNYKTSELIKKDTFFENEIEYILYGKLKDEQNIIEFKEDFLKLRTALNLAHIYMDASKRNEIIVMAEIMTPGPEALITQGIIASAWALLEAQNDVSLIDAGKNVRYIKTPNEWATSLQVAVNGVNNQGYIEPISKIGSNYDEYLRMFLHCQDRELKLLRIMDLIQINIKIKYDEGFLIKDYNTGLILKTVVEGKPYVLEKKY